VIEGVCVMRSNPQKQWMDSYEKEKKFITKFSDINAEDYTHEAHKEIFDNTIATKGLAPTPYAKIYQNAVDTYFDTRSAWQKFWCTAVDIVDSPDLEVNPYAAPKINWQLFKEAELRGNMDYVPAVTIAKTIIDPDPRYEDGRTRLHWSVLPLKWTLTA